VLVQHLPGLFRRGNELLDVFPGHRVVQGVGGGHGADENEHDQAHALLAVVGPMTEADTGAGKNEQRADRPRWRRVALGSFVKGGILDRPLGEQEKRSRQHKPEDRGDEQDFEDLGGLLPVNA